MVSHNISKRAIDLSDVLPYNADPGVTCDWGCEFAKSVVAEVKAKDVFFTHKPMVNAVNESVVLGVSNIVTGRDKRAIDKGP